MQLQILCFGGEPLLLDNKSILDYIVKKSSDMRMTVLTNGFHLLEYFNLLKTNRINYIQVTLDGAEDLHNRRRRHMTGTPTYEKIMRGVEKCLDGGLPIRIRMNVDSSNFHECLEHRDKLFELYGSTGQLFSVEVAPVFQMSNSEKQKVYAKLYKLNFDKVSNSFSQQDKLIAPHRPVIDTFVYGTKPRPVFAYCYDHGKTLFVDPYGDMYSCILSVGKKELAIGTYYPALTYKLNSIFTRDVSKVESCRKCKYTFICGGGCPLGLENYSDVMKPVCGKTIDDIRMMIKNIYETIKT